MIARTGYSLYLTITIATMAGCESSMPIEEARQAAVVTVDSASLDGATLEKILVRAPANAQPSRESANLVVSAFIDAALLREALLGQVDLSDSSLVAKVIEPDAIRGLVRNYILARVRTYPIPADEAVDSVTRLGRVRSFQTIAIPLPPNADSAAQIAFRDRVVGIFDQANDSSDFSALVRRYTPDSALISPNGFLPAMSRSGLPPGNAFDGVWRLAPGEIARPVLLPPFAMILRRSTVAEARPAIRRWLMPVLAAQRNVEWLDSLRTAKGLKQADDAMSRVRELVKEPLSGGGEAPLVSWQGGELTPDELRLWVSVLSPAERARLPESADSGLSLLLNQVSDRYIIAGLAKGDSAMPAKAYETMAPQFRAAMASLDSAYGGVLKVGDASTSASKFIESLTMGTTRYRPLPGALVWVLRQRAEITEDDRVLKAIVADAGPKWAARQDSLKAAGDSSTPGSDSGVGGG